MNQLKDVNSGIVHKRPWNIMAEPCGPRADLIRVTKLAYAREPVGDSIVYHYTIDTRQVWLFRIGDIEDTFWLGDPNPRSTHPKGWSGGISSWYTDDEKAKSENSEFSITSKWRPGLLPMYLVGEEGRNPVLVFSGEAAKLPVRGSNDDNERVAAVNIFTNSLKRFVIGPAIKPDITKAELSDLIDRWVNEHGFEFLRPLLDGKSLDDIATPSDEFEAEILRCLRDALPTGRATQR
jgi:hypothetical protein